MSTATGFARRQVGLGTFPFSGVFREIDQDQAESVVHRFLDLGGQYIETAPIYPRTAVDLPKILRSLPRESFLIGTKCVLHIDPEGNTASSGERGSIRKQCLNEIERLGVEHLDLLQAHITPEDVPPDVTSDALNELKSEGLVSKIGVSNATTHDLERYLSGGSIDFVQNRLSIVHRTPTQDISRICEANGIRLNPFQVIERGQLVDASSDAGKWREGDLRMTKAEYLGEVFRRVHAWAMSDLREIARQGDLSMEQLSIRWVFSQPQVTLPVVGASRPSQVESNMSGGTDPLPADVLSAIDQSYTDLAARTQELFGLSLEEYRGLG